MRRSSAPIHAFERTGRVYERLGIRTFKKLVRRGPLAIFSPTLQFPKEKTIPALRQLDRQMRKAEIGHVFILINVDGCLPSGGAKHAGLLQPFLRVLRAHRGEISVFLRPYVL